MPLCRVPGFRPTLLVAVVALAGGPACGGGDGTGPSGPPETSVAVAAVEVSPNPATVVAGQTLQLVAVPKAADGAAISGRQVTWATGDAGVATVNASGVVTGVAAGSATITATSEGVEGTSELTVIEANGITREWRGGTSGKESDWSTAANWSPAGKPAASDTVRVLGTTHPAVLSEDVVVGRLVVAGGVLRTAGRRLVVSAAER